MRHYTEHPEPQILPGRSVALRSQTDDCVGELFNPDQQCGIFGHAPKDGAEPGSVRLHEGFVRAMKALQITSLGKGSMDGPTEGETKTTDGDAVQKRECPASRSSRTRTSAYTWSTSATWTFCTLSFPSRPSGLRATAMLSH